MANQPSAKVSGDLNIHAIVVTYNGMKWIDKCLTSLVESSIPIHIIVIDNLSSDGTPDYIENKYPEVELIRSQENLGFGKGNNIGLKKALEDDADFVFLLNQDAWVQSETLEKLVHISLKNPDFGILSPTHYNWTGSAVDWFFLRMVESNSCPGYLNDLHMGKLEELYSCSFIHAACWLVTAKCLNSVGLFNPVFPHYGEDNNYYTRMLYNGFKGGICTNSNVFHDGRYKNPNEAENNIKLAIVGNLVDLTNPYRTIRGGVVVLTKRLFDSFNALLFYRKGGQLIFEMHIFIKTLQLLSEIKRSRQKYRSKIPFYE